MNDQKKPETFEELAAAYAQVFQPFCRAVQELGRALSKTIGEAFDQLRDNAFHRSGPVVRGSAVPVEVTLLLPQCAISLTRHCADRAYVSEHFGLPMHLLTDEERRRLPFWHCKAIFRYEISGIDLFGTKISETVDVKAGEVSIQSTKQYSALTSPGPIGGEIYGKQNRPD